MSCTKILCLFIALAFLIPACGQEQESGTGTAGIDALIVRSGDFPLYDRAIDGFGRVFSGSKKILTMAGPGDVEKLSAEIRGINPRVILAVGLRAARWIRDHVPEIPAVFCMSMHPVDNRLRTKSMTGVHLEPAPEDQLRAFAGVLPRAIKIGLLYDPQRTGRQVEAICKAAAGLGLQIIARPVESREEVPAALQEIVAKSQALWLLRDATVLTREFFNHALILQLSKRLPLIAYSGQFVRKGAFFSYTASYENQGQAAGDIANQILKGASPADIPLKHPQGRLYINMNTSEKLGVQLPSVRGHLSSEDVCRIE